jgi:signal peptidase I
MSEAARGIPSRMGIAALNLLAPGLGLLRVQRLRPGIALLLVSPMLLGLLTIVYALAPDLGFRSWAVLLGIALTVAAATYLLSIIWTWRTSARPAVTGPWWSRWYGIVAAFLAIAAINWPLQDLAIGHYKTFYLPAEAMLPSLRVDDTIVARMRPPSQLRRGSIILFAVGNSIYIRRIAALPGDRIELRDGVVVLNGQPVAQRLIGTDEIEATPYRNSARRYAEQFPGETAAHEIYDLGSSPFDDVAEQIVAPGHVFVLGDNRDHSVDSRVSHEEIGVEQLPIVDIRGYALFIWWSVERDRIGTPLTN